MYQECLFFTNHPKPTGSKWQGVKMFDFSSLFINLCIFLSLLVVVLLIIYAVKSIYKDVLSGQFDYEKKPTRR